MSQTETVSPGEVCSIDVAKTNKYGAFFDPVKYYKPEYSDTMTYSKIDTPERTAKLCKSIDNNRATPLCTIKFGVPYEQNKTNSNLCIINECPPSFTPNKQDKTICEKPPMENQIISEQSPKINHCDERITDWYTIENYHLGNKYQIITNIDGNNPRCMKPCTGGRVPGYTEDPVDGQSAGFYANTELSKCYPKNEYMGGTKYANTGDYCPIAWIYRFGQTKNDIVNSITSNIIDIEKRNGTNYLLNEAKNIANNEADIILADINKASIENVTIGYATNEVLAACSQLHTPERVQKAYDVCSQIKDNPATIETYVKDANKQRVLKQACQALFCNKMDDLISTLGNGKTAPCFPIDDPDLKPFSDKELFKYDQEQNPQIKIDDKPSEIVQPKNGGKGLSILQKAITLGIFILIGVPLLFVFIRFCIWLWRRVIKPTLWKFIIYVKELLLLKSRAEIKEKMDALSASLKK